MAAGYPDCAVVAGTTTEGAYRRAPFHVVHAGQGQTRFGAVNRVPAASIETLRRSLAQTGFDASWVDDIWPAIWHKVAVNCCINALSAVRRCRNGELLDSAEAMATMRGLAAEVEQVMAAIGLGFSFPRLFDDVVAVIETTADNYSSMCQDLSRGHRTEIDYINGYICARGDECGVATPLNLQLLQEIRAATGS